MANPGPTMNCVHCGGTLSLNDMTKHNCPFCGQVLPHHARAAEHAVLVNQVLANQFQQQYPGTPPGQIPQIGYHMGAGLNGMQEFQNHQINNAMKRAWSMSLIMIVISVVMSMVIGGIVIAMMLLF